MIGMVSRMLDKIVELAFGPNVPYTWEETTPPTCEYCGEDLPCERAAHIIQVTYQGFAGTYYDQPEPAEGIIECHQCQDETDAQFEFDENGYCLTGDHEVTVVMPEEDPDDAYERAQDMRELRRHL